MVNIVDVVIVWHNGGLFKVLGVPCRTGQLNEHVVLPECVRGNISEYSKSEIVVAPLRRLCTTRVAGICLLENYVEYNAWVFPTPTSEVHFHLVNNLGLQFEMRKDNLLETGQRTFEPPAYFSVSWLLENGSRHPDQGQGLRGQHFLGLRHLKWKLLASVTAAFASA